MQRLRLLCLHGYHGNFTFYCERFRGWQRTQGWLAQVFADEPRFDGVFGFSQGAAHTSDRIVPAADSRVLAEQFTSPVVLEHAGGHIIPGIPSIRTKVVEFLQEMADRRDSAEFTGQDLK